MATTFVIACPDCAKQVKVSDEHVGKRVKCKECGHVYPVTAPDGTPAQKTKMAPTSDKAKAPAPKPKPKASAPPAPPSPQPEKPNLADDPEYDPNKYTLEATDDTLPRCPFCAKEMESQEAMICLHCGYNTRTRTRPQVKAVYQPSFIEMFMWLLPGILCFLTIIGMLVWYLIFWRMIEIWLVGSWFEDEAGPPPTYLGGLGPGFMRLYQGLIIIFLSVPLVRIGYKRLFINNKPPERTIKEEWA
jgi:predicted Zn finger-like uncharacterized protein